MESKNKIFKLYFLIYNNYIDFISCFMDILTDSAKISKILEKKEVYSPCQKTLLQEDF